MTANLAFTSVLEVTYDGRCRIVEPHDYGVRGNRDRLLAYQMMTESGPKETARGWRLFDVERITTCAVLDRTFPGSRRHLHERHNEWHVLYARVDGDDRSVPSM